ncbi:MAG TPA: TIGR03435 family protein [Bryobacteraceae bacterium]|nr:TIGR03435 family protein [Bryobacteraceae bacterium]
MLITALASFGQTGPPAPRYDVSSIEPNAGSDLQFAFRIEPNGTLAATGITLKRLMMTAYNVQGFRIIGGPAWVASKRWDVQAKPSQMALPEQVRPMLRILLEQRFELRAHSEKRTIPVYELVNDPSGSKVPAVTDSEVEPVVHVATGSIELTNAKSATFASQLSYALAKPVIDKTGLSGQFDFRLSWTPEPGEDGGPTTAGLPPSIQEQSVSTQDRPSIFTAIRDQLGLRLKTGHGAVDVVVIDGVSMPAAN